jgi:hypothetical protein
MENAEYDKLRNAIGTKEMQYLQKLDNAKLIKIKLLHMYILQFIGRAGKGYCQHLINSLVTNVAMTKKIPEELFKNTACQITRAQQNDYE